MGMDDGELDLMDEVSAGKTEGMPFSLYYPLGIDKNIKKISLHAYDLECYFFAYEHREYLQKNGWLPRPEGNDTLLPGIYVLVDSTELSEIKNIYIGQSKDVLERFKQHVNGSAGQHKYKAGFFLLSKAGFNKAHVDLLERASIHAARIANRYSLPDNEVRGTISFSDHRIKDEATVAFGIMDSYFRALGFNLFVPKYRGDDLSDSVFMRSSNPCDEESPPVEIKSAGVLFSTWRGQRKRCGNVVFSNTNVIRAEMVDWSYRLDEGSTVSQVIFSARMRILKGSILPKTASSIGGFSDLDLEPKMVDGSIIGYECLSDLPSIAASAAANLALGGKNSGYNNIWVLTDKNGNPKTKNGNAIFLLDWLNDEYEAITAKDSVIKLP